MSVWPRLTSIGARLSWLFAVLTFGGLSAASLAIYAAMAFTLRHEADKDLSQRSSILLHVLGEASATSDLDGLRHKLEDFASGQRDLEVAVTLSDGSALYRNDTRLGADRSVIAQRYASGPQNSAQLEVKLDTTTNDRLLTRLVVALAITTLAGTLVVSLGGSWLVRRGMAPLHALARDLQAVSAASLGHRLTTPDQADELVPVIAQFNALMQRLEAAYRQLEGFNADVAHELRTPLAILISRSELDLAQGRSLDELRDGIASNLDDLNRLAAIVKDMLFLSRADRGVQARLSVTASLADEAAEVVDFYDASLEEAGLHVAIMGDAVASFDAGLVRRALSNLLSNAIRYSERGSTLTMRIGTNGRTCALTMENPGSQVAQEDIDRIFHRFFRADAAREHGSEHHGLGLAIVAAIARMHGGGVYAQSENGVTAIGFTLNTGAAVDTSIHP